MNNIKQSLYSVFFFFAGLVFYQHKSMHYAHHGYAFRQNQLTLKRQRDYEDWKEGKFVPTKRQLQEMKADGLEFPDNVKTLEKKSRSKKVKQ